MIVEFNSKQDLNIALSAFKKKLVALKYNSNKLKKCLPKMLVNGAPIIKNKSKYKEFIEHSNPDIEKLVIAGETFEVVTIIEKGKSCSVILEISPKIRGDSLKIGGLNFGFLRVQCKDYINLIRCTYCCFFSHKKSECKGDFTCSWCIG